MKEAYDSAVFVRGATMSPGNVLCMTNLQRWLQDQAGQQYFMGEGASGFCVMSLRTS